MLKYCSLLFILIGQVFILLGKLYRPTRAAFRGEGGKGGHLPSHPRKAFAPPLDILVYQLITLLCNCTILYH